jgi:hypothetical protein
MCCTYIIKTSKCIVGLLYGLLYMCYCKRNWRFSVETCFASDKNCNLILGYFVFQNSKVKGQTRGQETETETTKNK